MEKYKIFIVEDDEGIANGIATLSANWNYQTHTVKDFTGIMEEFTAFAPHIVLIDIKLPFYDGYHWCAQIRKVSKVPIIFLSSASDNINIVMAMNMGADDFIAKPFDFNVLMAKIKALLRRSYDFGTSLSVIGHRGTILNTDDATFSYGEKNIPLTKNEYRILLTLLENKGKVISRERLMQALWKTDMFVDDNTLTVNINRLRKKLKDAGLEDFITTKHGFGYMIM